MVEEPSAETSKNLTDLYKRPSIWQGLWAAPENHRGVSSKKWRGCSKSGNRILQDLNTGISNQYSRNQSVDRHVGTVEQGAFADFWGGSWELRPTEASRGSRQSSSLIRASQKSREPSLPSAGATRGSTNDAYIYINMCVSFIYSLSILLWLDFNISLTLARAFCQLQLLHEENAINV